MCQNYEHPSVGRCLLVLMKKSVFGNTQFLSVDICKQIYKRNHIVVQKILNCQRCTSGKKCKYYGGIVQAPHVVIYSIYAIYIILDVSFDTLETFRFT